MITTTTGKLNTGIGRLFILSIWEYVRILGETHIGDKQAKQVEEVTGNLTAE
jgi:hypothetical protein